MLCPLCGAKNSETALRCSTCGVSFAELPDGVAEHVVMESVDLTRPTVRWDRLAIVFGLLLLLVLPWFFMGDLLDKPKDVREARDAYSALKERYLAEKVRWDREKDQILFRMYRHRRVAPLEGGSLDVTRVPMEVLLAYLVDELGLEVDSDVAVYAYPEPAGPRIIVSKYQKGIWPLKVLLSLDLSCSGATDGTKLRIVRLRRGAKPISEDLAWHYFGEELLRFRRIESVAGGIAGFSLKQGASGQDFSWSYRHRPMGSPV